MLRKSTVFGCVALAIAGANTAIAQTSDENDAQFIEIQAARTQMDEARRSLEQAARTIAAQAPLVSIQDRNALRSGNLNLFFGGQRQLGLRIINADNGALVTEVLPGSGSESAGIRVGDVIQSIDGMDVTDGDEPPSDRVMTALEDVDPGDSVAVVVERAGETLAFDVETEESTGFLTFGGPDGSEFHIFTPQPAAPLTISRLGDDGREFSIRAFGLATSPWRDMELVAVSEGLGRYFGTGEGLLVVRGPDDDDIDIEDGDVILSISGRTPNSPEHAIRILSSFESGETIEFSIMRDGRREAIEYAIPEVANQQVLTMPAPD